MEEKPATKAPAEAGKAPMKPNSKLEFKPLTKDEYYLDDTIKLFFRLPDPNGCPSYLDLIRFAPLHETYRQKRQNPSHELTVSYYRWNIENGLGEFSVSVKVEDIVAANESFTNSDDGIVYVVQYVSSPFNKVIATNSPFRVYPILEDSTLNLPEVFSDDGLIVLGSGSDSEPELLDEDDEDVKEESGGKTDKSSDGEELTIVMTESELRKMEEENRASNEKLRSFIDQYKNDLMELTKCNETLKQKLYDEQCKSKLLEKNRGKVTNELMELRGAKLRVEAILQETIAERERKLREEQNRTLKLEDEVSLLNEQVDNLRCCVDAHLKTKDLLLAELESLKNKPAVLTTKKSVEDRATNTLFAEVPAKPTIRIPPKGADKAKGLQVASEISQLESYRDRLTDENNRLQREKRKLWREIDRMKNYIIRAELTADVSELGEPFRMTAGQKNADLEERLQDLTKRLQAAKIEYISIYKENKRKEKALENICNWASLAKDGMSLEAPGPSQVPSLFSLTCNKYASFFNGPPPKQLLNNQSSAGLTCTQVQTDPVGFPSVKPRTSTLELVDDQYTQLGVSDAKLASSSLPLPPRQKRKYDILLRKSSSSSSAAATAGAPSATVSRAMQRGKMVVRGRHRANEPVRFPLKREMSSPGEKILEYTPSCLLPAACSPKPPQASRTRSVYQKKVTPKPTAPEPNSVEEAPDMKPVADTPPPPASASIQQTPRGTNTYSAAGLISDLETDASNTDEEPSVINPHTCPLCLTSILDYEAHMREAHQKQPCPICGQVFDTNIPLYVMTYHIERHLEEVEGNIESQ